MISRRFWAWGLTLQVPLMIVGGAVCIGTVQRTFTLPSAAVSLLPLNQHPSSSVLPCPFDSASFHGIAVIGMIRMSTGVVHAGTWLVWRRAMEYIIY